MAHFVTFYSWKGGVGRSMAMANVAAQLARRGRSVLMVDWDLEAPGLERYFTNVEKNGETLVETNTAGDTTGLLGLLGQAAQKSEPGEHDWQSRLTTYLLPPLPKSYSNPHPVTPAPLHLLASGHGQPEYSSLLAEFSWDNFYEEDDGDEWLESLRNQWGREYDFVLIDSRTGLTDTGGVCTVQFPDWLVFVFTANDQSLEGGLNIIEAAQAERSDYHRDRAPLVVIPLLSRWDGDNEVDLAESWMSRFDKQLQPLTDAWLPRHFTPRQYLERTKVPHVARFSFGEPLPVLTHSTTDAGLPGSAYEKLARLLDSSLNDAGAITDSEYRVAESRIEQDGKIVVLLSYHPDDEQTASVIANVLADQGINVRFSEPQDSFGSLISNGDSMLLHLVGAASLTSKQKLALRLWTNMEEMFGSQLVATVLLPGSEKELSPQQAGDQMCVDMRLGLTDSTLDQLRDLVRKTARHLGT